MAFRTQARFRSDLVVRRAGRFRFDGYVDAGWKPPPRLDEVFVTLRPGQPFPRLGHACWWAPADEAVAEWAVEQRMNWDGRTAASSKGKRI
jgi:hypothetical protein